MTSILKTVAKAGFLVSTYTVICTYVFGVLGQFLAVIPPYATSKVIVSVLGAAVGTLNWLFTPALVRVAMYMWLTLPLTKLILYIRYKVVHL